MKILPKIAVFGASGSCGKIITQVLLNQTPLDSFIVNAVYRDKKLNIQHENLKAIQGDISIFSDVRKCIGGCRAVIVSVSGNGKPGQPSTAITSAAQTVIASCKQTDINKIILIAGAGAIETSPGKYIFDLPEFRNFENICRDHLGALELYRNSGLDFTMLCMPRVINQSVLGKYNVASESVPKINKWVIGDFEVADFVLKEIQNPQFSRARVGISSI